MNFSHYQQAFFAALLEGYANLVLRARAGSGKTFSLKWAIRKLIESGILPRSVIYVAFNVHVRAEAEETFRESGIPVGYEGVDVKTSHSCGYKMVSRHFFSKRAPDKWVEETKYRRIVKELVARVTGSGDASTKTVLPLHTLELLEDRQEMFKLVSVACRLIDLVRNNLVPRDEVAASLDGFILAHDLEVDPDGYSFLEYAVPRACSIGLATAKKSIDYGDMVWIPNVLDLRTPWYKFILVDEAQDLTRAQFEVTKRLRGRGARMVFVGDDRQAIYGFAGADVDSFNNIVTDLDAEVLPLSICYRCPTSHIELARELVPDIEASPAAELGELDACSEVELTGRLKRRDLVLCRTTAPLIGACLSAISEGIHARVRGRDIGAMLISTATKVSKLDGFVAPIFKRFAGEWLRIQIESLGEDPSEALIERLEDRVDCLNVIVDMGGPVASLEELSERIEGIFSDEEPDVWFSTVHRAKGLEEERVFILRPELLPHPRAKQEWQKVQEENLRYIAMTRSTRALIFVEETPAKATSTRARFATLLSNMKGAA